jgi:hypothetical protein
MRRRRAKGFRPPGTAWSLRQEWWDGEVNSPTLNASRYLHGFQSCPSRSFKTMEWRRYRYWLSDTLSWTSITASDEQ